MDEKVLLEWKEANKEKYSKFKQGLEEQLLKPYHQTILDLGDGNAESLQSVIANFAAISTEDGFSIYLTTQKYWYDCLVFASNLRKHFMKSQILHKITQNHRRSPKGHFGCSMFTSCSPIKEKAPTKSL